MKLIRSDELLRFEEHLRERLDHRLASEAVGDLALALQGYVLSGGKRVRPQLCIWTWQRCGADADAGIPAAVLDLASAWELFHAFLLAHDDIIDNGQTRRSQPSLHRRLASLDSGSEIFGINLAIVGGDLLFTSALQLLHELELPTAEYREVLRLFSRIASTTGFGQAIDIVQGHVALDSVREEQLLREYHWKTAAYTFEGPMVSAAIAAGAPREVRDVLARFASALGQAYQLQNDLIDLAAPAHAGCDIVQGKRTVTLVRGRQALAGSDRQLFDDRLARASQGDIESIRIAEQIRCQLLELGALDATAQLVETLLTQARDAAKQTALTPGLASGLGELLDRLERDYFTARA